MRCGTFLPHPFFNVNENMAVKNSDLNKEGELTKEVIVLRSVYGKVGQKYFIQPVKDPITGQFPSCVKRVNSSGDMIMSDAERNSGEYFIPENKVYIIEPGKTFDLSKEHDRKDWEAIKNCPYIAMDRDAKDENGNSLIDGTMGWTSLNPRYGQAELYVDRPGEEAQKRVSKKDKYRKALNFIYDDPKGAAGRLLAARLLGKNMTGVMDNDVSDYLISVAESDPDKIITIYTGSDTSLRLLLIEARDKKVIYFKNKLYIYADDIVLGATEDAVLTWMRDPKNKKTLDLIRKDVYPDLYPDEPTKK